MCAAMVWKFHIVVIWSIGLLRSGANVRFGETALLR
jgi:hypothetical protein